ncbi:TlpA family protein disulfide reductase [Candidatus Sulfidibacterium hydrothermale]|uniref:TlpA family protein disulfide reductase n=1 Tax=Candidatus Sulfidibacterium hydrothermale TaxID=2875962 RepID=UPI001F0A303A|nr:TlpA disulfide reductase family protein [Candidatus Sulfidibacterium hydrothermale]UBM62551.1 TlpA family protein disulfide reductase [Candidatus Sulfidibacterium hydrothermale]
MFIFNFRKIAALFAVMAMTFFISCSAPSHSDTGLHKGKVIIAGHIDKTQKDPMVISLTGRLLIDNLNQSDIIDSTGSFHMSFQLYHPIVIFLNYKWTRYPLYVRPGDSLYIRMSANEFLNNRYPSCQIEGPTAKISEEIEQFTRFSHQFRKDNPNTNIELPINQYFTFLKKRIQKGDSLIRAFDQKVHPEKLVLNYAKYDILYGTANRLVDYAAYRYQKHIPFHQEKELFTSRLFPVDNDSALISGMYLDHLSQYVLFYYLQDTAVKNLMKEKKMVAAYALVLNKIMKNEKPGLSRDVMYYSYLNNGLSYPRIEKYFLKVMNKGKIYKGNKLLYDKIENYKKALEKGNPNVAIINRFTGKEEKIMGNFFPDLLKKYSGKVILLDLWETSCGSCISEFPFATDLHKKYKGKPVVFVNICMHSNVENWKKLVKKLHISGVNYNLNQSQSALFISKFPHFIGFPTYVLIDKNGNIVDRKAPPPSSGKMLTDELDKYLNE